MLAPRLGITVLSAGAVLLAGSGAALASYQQPPLVPVPGGFLNVVTSHPVGPGGDTVGPVSGANTRRPLSSLRARFPARSRSLSRSLMSQISAMRASAATRRSRGSVSLSRIPRTDRLITNSSPIRSWSRSPRRRSRPATSSSAGVPTSELARWPTWARRRSSAWSRRSSPRCSAPP